MIEIHPFNNPEQVAKDLAEFKATDWSAGTLDDITQDYFRRFTTVPVYPIKVKAGTILFRARRNFDHNSEPFQKLDQLGLKPAALVKSFGRANIPGQSVFYCSNNEETVVKEVMQWYISDNGRAQDLITKGVLDIGWNPWTAMMTISAWRVKEELNLGLLFGNEQKRPKGIHESARNRYQLRDGESEDFNKSRNLIIDFFSSEFQQLEVSHHSQYILSALYAFNVMNNLPHVDTRGLLFDGIKYPSIANNFRGENYALNENAYRNKIDFLGANYCYTCNNHKTVINVDTTALIGRVYSTIAKPNGDLMWGESTNDWDYLAHHQNQVYPFFLKNMPNRFSKAVVTLKS